jgi:hypothetical protein
MNRLLRSIILATVAVTAQAADVAPAPNGIKLPPYYQDWRMIASSHRSDNKTLRVILGNDIAVDAARSGHTRPWPDGAILAKLVWTDKQHPAWPTATVPGNFLQAEFMVKNAAKYRETGGWGFARWKGLELKPYGDNAGFVQECFSCHKPVKGNDYVFTHPAVLPP